MTVTNGQITARLELMLANPSLPEYEPTVVAQTLIDELGFMPGITDESVSVLLGVAAQLLKHGVARQAERVLSNAMKR